MNLNKKGWLKEYLQMRLSEESESTYLVSPDRGNHPDQSLYALIQPTGIMYGYPILKGDKWADDVDHKSKVKILLMDSLLSSYQLIQDTQRNKQDRSELYMEAVQKIGEFYNALYTELYTSPTSLFGKRKADTDIVEKILDKRINPKFEQENFWTGFFHNSLLFLDIYFFRQWVQTSDDKMIITYLKSQKDNIRIDIVKVIAAAAHANHTIEEEERTLFEFFINSLELPADKKQEATSYFEEGVMVDDIPLPLEDTWILKKFLFELAILTTWADRKIEASEEEFLKEFNARLGFTKDDYEKSMIAVEGFVLEYWEELDKLRKKSDFDIVSEQFIERIRTVAHLHKDRLYKEIRKRGTLIKMIQKAKLGESSEQEKQYIREQLIQSMEQIPVFDVIALPYAFLTLPILMKILPEDFFKNIH